MSSESCSVEHHQMRGRGSFVHHLQDRLLSLPESLSTSPGADMESDESSVYYDLDSPPSSPFDSATLNMSTAVVAAISSQPSSSSSEDTSPEYLDCQHYSCHSPSSCTHPKTKLSKIPEDGVLYNGKVSYTEQHHFHNHYHNNGLNGDVDHNSRLKESYGGQVDESTSTDNESIEAFTRLSLDENPGQATESSQTDDQQLQPTPSYETNHRKPEHSVRESSPFSEDELILLDGGRETTPPPSTSSQNTLGGESDMDSEDDGELLLVRPELKRSSSLKSSKALEGGSNTCEKKIVRFADALGLDLAAVRTFMDEVPKIPKSAFKDLEGVEVGSSPSGSPLMPSFMSTLARPDKTIVPLFQQPAKQNDFIDRLNFQKVCLESATITDMNLCSIMGVVRVLNMDFHKSVFVRYSKDGWRTHYELQAKYVENSCDGFSDKFMFTIFAHTLNIGDRLEFALRYSVNRQSYWDNNRNGNYAFQCIPESPTHTSSSYLPSSLSLESWGTFI